MVTVIVSVFDNTEALERTLWGYAAQDCKEFRIILADDGSSKESVEHVRSVIDDLDLNVAHIWHENKGFRKARILNKAIKCAETEHLLFVDADVIPRSDFVSNHLRLLRPNYFISGGSHLNLPPELQAQIQRSQIESGELFSLDFLLQHEVDEKKFKLRLEKFDSKARLFDALFPRSNAFVGCNASCWKKDALAVNGFNEDWGYGGTDVEFGKRLTNMGVKSRRHSFILAILHQDHPRPYKDPEQVKRNKNTLKVLAKSGVTRIANGVDKISNEKITILYDT